MRNAIPERIIQIFGTGLESVPLGLRAGMVSLEKLRGQMARRGVLYVYQLKPRLTIH